MPDSDREPTRTNRVLITDDARAMLGMSVEARNLDDGFPVLAHNARTSNAMAPNKYAENSWIRNRYCYTLPRALWDEVSRQLGVNERRAEIVDLEYALSEVNGDHTARVGFWRGIGVVYPYLRRRTPPQLLAEHARAVGWGINQAAIDHSLRISEERANVFAVTTRAYLGWLLVNPQFLGEHDTLLTGNAGMIQRCGLEWLSQPQIPPFAVACGDRVTAEEWRGYRAPFLEFFRRWRLKGLAGPYLPIPQQPLLSGNIPQTVLAELQCSPNLFSLPDTYPLPSRDIVRDMLGDALHGSTLDDHLSEWRKLIASENPAKQARKRFARLFEVQHYFRVLQSRHGEVIHRRMGVLKASLASFLEVSCRTIDQDVAEIGRRLGATWAHSRHSWPFGPFSPC